MSRHEDLWEKAFQLAFFIVHDRSTAYQIVTRAVEKLGAQRSRERRRNYWRGRNTQLRIRRISRPDGDTLQWLVYLESEECEKEQERNNHQNEIDLVIRYIKHLVQLTTGASSFYVNVGLNRLLRNYSTPEVQQVYEFITEHYPAAEEYRKVKGRLMNRLVVRFGRFLKVHASEYRELRFETYEDQESWASLVEECLETFTPWSSQQACLRGTADLKFGDPGTGVWHPSSPNHVDGIETTRCHWFMHSPCYGELAKKLGLDSPEERLSVPQFLLNNDSGKGFNPSVSGRKTTPLTEAEIKGLKDRIDFGEAKRQQGPLRPLKIVAHGTVLAQLDPIRNEKRQFDIPEGTKLLEVRTETAEGDLTLATHWIDYTEWEGIAAGEYTIAFKEGRELLFKIVPADSRNEEKGGATATVESRSLSRSPEWVKAIGAYLLMPQKLPAYAFAALMLLVLSLVGTTAYYRTQLTHEKSTVKKLGSEMASQKAAIASREQSLPPTKIIATYLLTSGLPTVRGTGNPEEAVVTIAPADALVMLDLAVAQGTHGSYRATLSSFPEERELLRQNLLTPIKKGNNWVVEVALPSPLVADQTHYLMTLETVDSGGRTNPVSRYLFEVRK